MIRVLEERFRREGCRLRAVSVERLEALREDLNRLASSDELNGFQQYILSGIYQFDLPSAFEARQVLVVATPTPACAKVEFEWEGKKRRVFCICRSDETGTGEPPNILAVRWLEDLLSPAGYRLESAGRLPLKRLAVRSGLSVYGRNNITYVEGMGSYYTLSAFYTDLPPDPAGDNWREVSVHELCASCGACVAACPTGAIRPDRFLIDTDRCLTFFNESPGEWPAWIPQSVHRCLVDCLACQTDCPLNAEHRNQVAGPIYFDADETRRLIEGLRPEDAEPDLSRRMRLLMLDDFPPGPVVGRNLRLFLEHGEQAYW